MAHSNKSRITVNKTNWMSEGDIKKTFSHVENVHAGYRRRLDAALAECQQCIDNYSKIICQESIVYLQTALDNYKAIKVPHDECLYDVLHRHQIMENNKMIDMKIEQHINDRKALKANIDEHAKDDTTHVMQGAILHIKTALAQQKMAETANRTGFLDDFEEEKPLGARRKTYKGFKDQPTFHPKSDITPNSTSVQFNNWLSDLQSAYDTSNCKVLSTRDQQKFVQNSCHKVSLTFSKTKCLKKQRSFQPQILPTGLEPL